MSILGIPILAAAAYIVAAACLLWLAWVDLKKFLLPDIGNALLAFCAVLFHGLTDFHYLTSLHMISGCVAGLFIFMAARWYGFLVKKVEGVGLGDVKFAAAAGLWLGPFGVSVMAVLASLGLFLVGMAIVLATRRPMQGFYLPFGVSAAPVTLILISVYIFYRPLEQIIFW